MKMSRGLGFGGLSTALVIFARLVPDGRHEDQRKINGLLRTSLAAANTLRATKILEDSSASGTLRPVGVLSSVAVVAEPAAFRLHPGEVV